MKERFMFLKSTEYFDESLGQDVIEFVFSDQSDSSNKAITMVAGTSLDTAHTMLCNFFNDEEYLVGM